MKKQIGCKQQTVTSRNNLSKIKISVVLENTPNRILVTFPYFRHEIPGHVYYTGNSFYFRLNLVETQLHPCDTLDAVL
jgi:hypothetical protein